MMRQEAANADAGARRARLLRGSWVPAALILGSAAFLGIDVARPAPPVAASVSYAPDTDGDGLVDIVELSLGTLVRCADTDGDGISDGEELARNSSPRRAFSHPRQRPVDVGIIAHSYDRMVHVQLIVYSADGELRGKNIAIQALAGPEGRAVEIPASTLIRLGGLTSLPASDGGTLFVLDLPVRPRTIYTSGSLSIAASVAAPLTGEPGSADVLDLVNIDGTICQRVDGDRVMSSALPSGDSGKDVVVDASGSAEGTPSVFLPVFGPGLGDPVSGNTVSSSTPGQICVQQTVAVGVAGGSVVQEVVAAECVEGWDGFCSTACAGSVGDRVRTLDPITYSGG